MMNDMASPATKQVIPEDTFLAYRATKGIEIAFMIGLLPVQEASEEIRYRYYLQSNLYPSW